MKFFYNFSFERDVYYLYLVLSSYITINYLYITLNYKKYDKLVSRNESPLSGIVCKDINNKTVATSFVNKKENIYFLNFKFLSDIPDDSEIIVSDNKLRKILQDYHLPYDLSAPIYADYYEIYYPLYYNTQLGIISSYKNDIIEKIKWNKTFVGFYLAFWTIIVLGFFHLAICIQNHFGIV